jgi:membrane protein DedA with SNARE-associated domain/rhodanese-related sulfurtransferase
MSFLLQLIEEYGLVAVFLNVLIEQGGAPVPAYPTLVLSGALAAQGKYSPAMLLAVAVLAALIADLCWYYAGRRYGSRVMALLCRISLSPDSCVRQTQNAFERWGAASLLVAKFIPGFASVASALAGTTSTRLPAFILFDALGSALWAGSAIYIGFLFSSALDNLLNVLDQLGRGGLLLIGLALAAFIGAKWWQRVLFLRSLRMARISVSELYDLLQQGQRPLVVDVRSSASQREGRIPGAIALSEDLGLFAAALPAGAEVIVYCACPNDASAARVARNLMKHGYTRVRPLHGGIDAWRDAGYKLGSGSVSPGADLS